MSDPTLDVDLHCDACEQSVDPARAVRRETFGGLDPAKWQTLCCPDCGRRVKTVLVGDLER